MRRKRPEGGRKMDGGREWKAGGHFFALIGLYLEGGGNLPDGRQMEGGKEGRMLSQAGILEDRKTGIYSHMAV